MTLATGSCWPSSLFVPVFIHSQVLRWVNTSHFSYHPGSNHTVSLVKWYVWWPAMDMVTHSYVATCTTCSCGKVSHQSLARLLCLLLVPSRPWSHITLDFMTGLLPSQNHTTILIVINRFSKAVHFIALLKLPSAKETSDLLVQHIFRLHGIPSDIVSVWGTHFISQVSKSFCQALGVLTNLSSGFHS